MRVLVSLTRCTLPPCEPIYFGCINIINLFFYLYANLHRAEPVFRFFTIASPTLQNTRDKEIHCSFHLKISLFNFHCTVILILITLLLIKIKIISMVITYNQFLRESTESESRFREMNGEKGERNGRRK